MTDDSARDPYLVRPYRSYIRLHWRLFVYGLLALLCTNLLDSFSPLLVGRAIDEIIGQKPFADVGHTVLIIFAITVFLAIFRFLWRYFWSQFHHAVAEDLRNRLYAKFTDLGPSFFSRRTTGELMSLINNDVNSFRMAIGPGILILFDSACQLIILPILMWQIAPTWTWKCLILTPFVPFIVRYLIRRTDQAYRRQQDRFAEMAGAAQEIISGIRVIKSYAQEENQTRHFNKSSKNFLDACDKVAQSSAVFGPTLEVATATGAVILLFVGAGDVMAGTVTLGSFFAFYQYVQKMIWPMEGLGDAFAQLQMGKAAFERIRSILTTRSDVAGDGEETPTDLHTLEVKNLTFSYPGDSRAVLSDISFTLKKGQVLGVVGVTGSGKSALAEALCQLYPSTPGAILIDGRPIEGIRRKNLRHLISMVPQDAFVFSRKLGENIAYGPEHQHVHSVEDAASLVHIHDEISLWPEAYDTLIGERGVNLSGGQRQRVTVARALMRSAPLIIIDDALSAIDARTGAEILQNLKHRLRGPAGCAALVISHRLANISWADQILVLNEGRIEAIASHEELLNISSTYRRLHELQSRSPQASEVSL
jgi:ATP-binding cassette, subfamily B, multidrug efflux pump